MGLRFRRGVFLFVTTSKMDNLLLYINMNNLSDTYFFAVSNQSSTFLRPRFIQIVVLEFTHFELVYILVLFFYTLHGGVMKSSVNLAKLVVVILSCTLDGVSAGENRGKCVKKGRTRATQDIYDDSRSLFTANGRFAAREEERFCHLLSSPKRNVRVKNSSDISQSNKTKV